MKKNLIIGTILLGTLIGGSLTPLENIQKENNIKEVITLNSNVLMPNKINNTIKQSKVNNKQNNMQKPILSVVSGSVENLKVYTKIGINFEGPYASVDTKVDGVVYYEKILDLYIPIRIVEGNKSINLKTDIGKTKTLVARAYVYNKYKQKVYSEYSNEVVVGNKKIATPVLSIISGETLPNGNEITKLGIILDGPYATPELKADGVEYFEKINNEYKLLETSNKGTIQMEQKVGETKTLVARAYVYNKYHQKVYSEYSNEVVVGNKF